MRWKAGIYLRLSHEDNSEDNSIDNQREIIKEYAVKNNIEIVKEYVDNGYSGLLTSRPALDNMILDIRQEKINMVIVKDSSRLSRNDIFFGICIKEIFPQYEVRYVSVIENLDTGEDYDINLMYSIRGFINNKYSRDISNKVKSVKTNLKKQGKYVESFVPYGYRKDKEDKYKVVIEEETAENVKLIYNMYLNGYSQSQIARELTKRGIDTPKKHKGFSVSINEWRQDSVSSILREPFYTGKMIINKYYTNIDTRKKVVTNRENWQFVDNTHEAIISQEDFDKVEELLSQKRTIAKRKYEYLLKGLVFCKNCGARMQYKSRRRTKKHNKKIENGEETWYFKCRMLYKFPSICNSGHTIRERDLNTIILNEVKKKFGSLDFSRFVDRIKESNNRNRTQLNTLVKSKDRVDSKIELLYDEYVEGKIDKEVYSLEYSKLKENRNKLQQEIKDRQEIEKDLNQEFYESLLEDFKEAKQFDNEILKKLIKRVEVAENKEVEVIFNF